MVSQENRKTARNKWGNRIRHKISRKNQPTGRQVKGSRESI